MQDRIEPVDWAVCALCVLKIIPVDFETLVPGGIDFRNILYIYAGLVLYPRVNFVVKEIRGPAWGLLGWLGAYFLLTFSMKLFHNKPVMLSNIYGSVWTLWLMFLLIWRGRSWRRLDLFLKATLGAIVFSACFGLIMVVRLQPLWSLRAALLGRHGSTPHAQLLGLSPKVFEFAYQIAALVIASFVYVAYAMRGKERTLWLCLSGIGLAALFFNAERSAALAAITMCGWFLIRSRKKACHTAFVIVALGMVALTWRYMPKSHFLEDDSITTLAERIEHTQRAPNDVMVRWRMQVAGFKAAMRSPLGNADSAYRNEFRQDPVLAAVFSSSRSLPAPHNHFINVGYITGWLGGVIMLLFLGSVWACQRRISFSMPEYRAQTPLAEGLADVILFSLAAIFVNSLFHNPGIFTENGVSVIFVGLLGAAAAMPVMRHTGRGPTPVPGRNPVKLQYYPLGSRTAAAKPGKDSRRAPEDKRP